MTQALPASPRDLPQCLDGLIRTIRRLSVEYGVATHYGTLPDDVGAYNAATNTITIDRGAAVDDVVEFLIEIWKLRAIGPEAVRWGTRTPHLHLVPPSALDTA